MDLEEQTEPVETSGPRTVITQTPAEVVDTNAVAAISVSTENGTTTNEAAPDPPESLEEETFESLQSEVESEEMHDAEAGSSPNRAIIVSGAEQALQLDEQEGPPGQVLMEEEVEPASLDPLHFEIGPLFEDDEMVVGGQEQREMAAGAEALPLGEQQDEPPAEAADVDAGDDEEGIVRMEDDYEDADDRASSSDVSQPGEEPADYHRGNFHVSVNRVNEAIRRLIARGDTSGTSLSDLLDQETFMQRLRRFLFSLDHDRRRNRRNRRNTADGNGDGEGEGVDLGAVNGRSSEDEVVDEVVDEPVDGEMSGARRLAEEEAAENSERFDTNLAAEHSYLGANMSRVSGVNYLEEGQQHNLMLFLHEHILFPGEVLPFMISESIIEADIDAQNGFLFGVCFPVLSGGNGNRTGISASSVNNESSEKDDNIYGVTCQIYEKGTDARGNTLIKSRALQRFVTKVRGFSSPPQFITAHPQTKSYGLVKILPEIFLREPLKCIDMGAMNRFRDIASMQESYKRFQAASTAWPAHVYDYYSITTIIEKARTQLAEHKIDTMPTDPVQLTFWLVRNLHLSESMMKTIFTTDSVNKRMKMIASTFKQDAMFTCRYCGNSIANCRELFAMSKHGVQTQYCNSAGYIHETNTVYQLLRNAVQHNGEPSTEFSWFPGYKWHIVLCKICSHHIGWEFQALRSNLVPKSFFGISSSSVRICTHAANPRDVIFQNFMSLVRREME